MNNKCLLFLCLLFISLQPFAQKTFPGYYVNNDDDTIQVTFPNYKQWEHNPQQIKVQTSDGKEQVLTPQNTRRVSIVGYDTYESRRFSRLLNPIDEITDYSFLSSLDSKEEVHGFLLQLTTGSGITLYEYKDKRRKNYFIEQQGGEPAELIYKLFMDEEGKLVEQTDYRTQLRVALADKIKGNKKLEGQLQKLRYDSKMLVDFVNLASGEKERKKKMYPTEFAVLGGGAYNTFKVTSNTYSNVPAVKMDYDPSVAPVIGISFIDYSQRNFARNFFTTQLKYYRFKNTGTYVANEKEMEVVFQSSIIQLALGLGRNFIQTPQYSWYTTLAPVGTFLPNSQTYFDYDGINKRKVSFLTCNIGLQTGIRMKNGLGIWLYSNILPTETQRLSYFKHSHRSIQLGAEWRLKNKS